MPTILFEIKNVMKMKLSERKIEAPNGISCKFYQPAEIDTNNMDILVVSYSGIYPDGALGAAHGAYIAVKAMQGLHLFAPDCVILDFRELQYHSGNTLLRVFQDISTFKDSEKEPDAPYFPVLAVTSEKSRAGFLALVAPKDSPEPDWHFSTIQDAISAASQLARRWFYYPRVA
jgi:hypothetical protein